MKMKKNNKVYGIIGVRSVMSNWNAGFDGNPKNTINGEIFGSDKALKYVCKKKWEEDDKKVFGLKSLQINNKGNIQPRDLNERYEYLFNTPEKNYSDIVRNLLTTIDIQNFGITFASKKSGNISLHGPIQIGQGLNKYTDTTIEIDDILSPYRNPNEKSEDASMTSKGNKITVDEAHYFYGFSVNPNAYKDIAQLVGIEGYTEEAYTAFKNVACTAATYVDSCSKFGCDNEFSLFVNLKENSKKSLGDLANYISFYKDGATKIIDLTKLEFLNAIDDINSIEIFYDTATIELKGNLSKTVITDIKIV